MKLNQENAIIQQKLHEEELKRQKILEEAKVNTHNGYFCFF